MKKLYTLILLLTINVSLVMAQPHLVEGYLIERDANNANVELYYPVVTGQGADKINAQIMHVYAELNPIKKITRPVDGETLVQMVDQSIAFAAEIGLTRSINELPYTHFGSWVYTESDVVISIIIAQFIDMGQPIPRIRMNAININKITGEIFDIHDLITNPEHISELAAEQFCRDHKLPTNSLRLITGLNYELSEMPLAKTIGITKKGLTMFYTRGEIAPTNIPPIIISLPFSRIDDDVYSEGIELNEISVQQGVKQVKKLVYSYIKEQRKVRKHKKY